MPTSAEFARIMLTKLVEHVFRHRDGVIRGLTYQELAERIGRLDKHGAAHPHGMGFLLDTMGHLLKDIGDDWGESIPQIQSLVVLKTGAGKNLPSDGIEEFWRDYRKMSRTEKENRVQVEFDRIAAFGSRWNDVLVQLSLPMIVEQGADVAPTNGFGIGGESPAHKALKEYIRQHPELVGATREWVSFIEYPLPSLDVIDVLFKSKDACVAVEVKSAVSDGNLLDYQRGLFQTVKYGALLNAMSKSGHDIPATITTVLALQSKLPSQFRELAKVLDVTIFENIGPTGP